MSCSVDFASLRPQLLHIGRGQNRNSCPNQISFQVTTVVAAYIEYPKRNARNRLAGWLWCNSPFSIGSPTVAARGSNVLSMSHFLSNATGSSQKQKAKLQES